jgi:hypothetical protein
MASITLRSLKGSPLTITEMDNNFSNINTELGSKLDISAFTAADILTKLKTVDGSSSGLDADLVDGLNPDITATANTLVARNGTGGIAATTITGNLTGNVTGNVTGTAATITEVLPVNKGGTGGNSTTAALNNLLPSGEVSGYVLKTGGEGSYYWQAETGAIASSGTRVDSTRVITTATANQTLFTAPAYVPGSNQLRVYINGVRQFDSAYTETSTTSFTLSGGVSAGVEVLAEVDAYFDYAIPATDITYSPSGTTSATNVQAAIDEVVNDVTPYTMPVGGIILWSGLSTNIPNGWALCDGTNGTPNLINRFVVGATGLYAVGASGGSKDAIVPSHSHTGTGSYRNNYLARVELSTGANGGSTNIAEDGTISPWITSGRNDGGSRALRFQNKGYNSTSMSITTSTEGSSATNANLPPYYALCYIMKV